MLSKKIIFITGNLTQPRVIKRIKAFKEQGFDICVYGFDRGTFQNVNVLSSDIPVECLGPVSYTHLDVYKRQSDILSDN